MTEGQKTTVEAIKGSSTFVRQVTPIEQHTGYGPVTYMWYDDSERLNAVRINVKGKIIRRSIAPAKAMQRRQEKALNSN